MPKKKKQETGEDSEYADGRSLSSATKSQSHSASQSEPAQKKPAKTKAAPPPPPSHQVLVICRNKHWRYISSFHGPWLQLPAEILETIANANYNTPRPRPIDPSVFFDLVKIRRLVDEATDLTVRAASGVTAIGNWNHPAASHHVAALGLGFSGRPPPQAKLSAERRHRMREQAAQKLAKAYRLDEIACSVATMQSASSLEEVASLVLQRNAQDPDAKYVHFFHEKIPSRHLAECTSLLPLNEIIAARPTDPEPLRTRAVVRIFKGDLHGAVGDLTEALKLHRLYRPAHTAPKLSLQEGQLSERQGPRRRQEDIILKEEDQPSSLEIQLLFQRAGVYLAIACRHVAAALPDRPWMASDSDAATEYHEGERAGEGLAPQQQAEPELSSAEKEAHRKMFEARKLVRQNAKRALRDITAYLSHFEYSPDLPIEIAEDFTRKVNSAIHGARVPRSHSYPHGSRNHLIGDDEGTSATHRIYALSDLFTSSPPSGLPPYPSTELVPMRRQEPASPQSVQTTTETLTCHPLLTDALHALLLCHCLIQTSAKELLRHAYMVARLVRLADGYPVFQSSRCPARADWVEVLRAGGNWIQLVGTWEDLCAPAPLPLFQSTGNGTEKVPVSLSTSKQARALPASNSGDGAATTPDSPTTLVGTDPRGAMAEIENYRKDRIHQQAVLDSLGDDRVNDESSLRLAIRARQLRAEHDYRLDKVVAALDAKIARGEVHDPLFHLPYNKTKATDPVCTPSSNAPASGGPPPPQDVANPTAAAEPVHAASSEEDPRASSTNGNSDGKASSKVPTAAAAAAASINRRAGTGAGPAAPAIDDGRDYPILTERASAIARWVLEAPPPSASSSGGGGVGGASMGPRKRKKKAVGKGPGSVLPGDELPQNGLDGDGEREGEEDREGDGDGGGNAG
ncbi:hypothetical protein VTK56DRAFT_5807 [Thermocarpiscus australiensis]